MNNDTHLIWEARQRQAILLENSELVWQALQEAHNAIEEAKITPDMVSQINQTVGTNLTIDQLQQIQQITNPGISKAIGGALGKLGGFLKNTGAKAASFAKQQVTDPNSGLRQGIQKAGELGQAGLQKGAELAKQGAGAIARGVEKGAGAVATGANAVGDAAGNFADGVKDGYDSTQQPGGPDDDGNPPPPPPPGAAGMLPSIQQPAPAVLNRHPETGRFMRPGSYSPSGEIRDPQSGRFMKGNKSGVQFAKEEQEELEDVFNESILNRPGWANKRIN
jgi:hypothetical protein